MGCPPVPLSEALVGPPSPTGRCPSGFSPRLLVPFFCGLAFFGTPFPFSPRLSELNPVGFLSLTFLVFALLAMALCAFRRTVSLDVSQLAAITVSKFASLLLIILRVIRFTQFNS